MNGNFPSVAGMAVQSFKQFADPRGVLVPVELTQSAPFAVQRLFWISDVPPDTRRGAHAHKDCSQFYICCVGSVDVEIWDGTDTRLLTLTRGSALHVPAGIFSTEIFKAPDSVLLVLCDRAYDPADYVHTREEFLNYRRR